MKRAIGLALAIALVVVPSAFAQVSRANVYGKVTDESGAVLPGANITLTGDSGSQSSVSGAEGAFRFLGLSVGNYEITAALAGFTTVTRQVVLVTGQSVDLTYTLKVATVEETLLVTAETPVVDTKKLGTSTTFTRDELERVPQARDPWAILRTVPGVVVDRVSIAGNEGGQQSNFQAKGSDAANIAWNLDGVEITDVSATGASPTYYDYDAFEEIAISTSGNNLNTKTGGLGINFATKRGTNRWRGSARGLITHDDMQWSNIAGTEFVGDSRLGDSDKADHTQQINDYGLEIGGPIIKDKLHLWGSYGKQDIRIIRSNQTSDKTKLESFNAKLNWQIGPNTSMSVFFFNGKKAKDGRTSGSLQWSENSLWDQGPNHTDFMPGNIHGFLKFELNHIVNPDFFMNIKYSNYDTGFILASRDLATNYTWSFDQGIALGGAIVEFGSTRPLKNVTDVSGNYFASGWGGNHEIKFGFGYKKAESNTTSIYGSLDDRLGGWDFGPGARYAWVHRDTIIKYSGEYFYGFLGDTFTKDRLTVALGVRFDNQKGSNSASLAVANPSRPDLLPAVDYPGGGQGINWSDISPRLGLTYALNDSRTTVLRANFAQYANNLNLGAVTYDNPLGPAFQAYIWNDANGDLILTQDEVDYASGLQYFSGHDPSDPANITSVNQIDPDYKAPKETEITIGLDHELMPDLAVSLAYNWRRNVDQRDWNIRLGQRTANYTPNAPVTANGFTANTFSPDGDLVTQFAGGRFKTNRPDYHQSYSGFEASLIKRLSNKWMARVAFGYNNHTETLDGPGAVQNPTRSDTTGSTVSGPQVNGGRVSPRSSGSGKGDVFYSNEWQISVMALYEMPKNFEIATQIFGRQGYPRPIILRTGAGQDGRIRALATPTLDEIKLPTLWNVDLRLANNIRLGGEHSLTLAAEVFNVFNNNVELNRQRNALASSYDRLDEILSPRILRVGARLSF